MRTASRQLQTWAVESQPGEAARGDAQAAACAAARPRRNAASLTTSSRTLKGKPDNGKAIFNRICVACHIVNGVGVDYGPDLTKVATRLKKQDIIESVIDPSAKVDPKYLTTIIQTKDDESYTGFTVAETADDVTLRIAGGKNQVIKKSDIGKRETDQSRAACRKVSPRACRAQNFWT